MLGTQVFDDGRIPDLSSSMVDSGATVKELRLEGGGKDQQEDKREEPEVEPRKNFASFAFMLTAFLASVCSFIFALRGFGKRELAYCSLHNRYFRSAYHFG